MAESSIMWTTGGAGDGASTYTETQIFNWLRRTMSSDGGVAEAVHLGYANALNPTVSGSNVLVDTGAATVYGIPYENTASLTLPVTVPTIGTTGFRVNLHADWTLQTVRATVNRSADGTVAIPALVQTAGTTWDSPIATGTITTGGVITLTDARVYCHGTHQIGTAQITAAAVTGAKIASATITEANMAALSVGTPELIANSVTAAKIANNTITATQIAATTITATQIAANTITAGQLAAGSVTTAVLANQSVTYPKISGGIPILTSREGGNVNAWGTVGTTVYDTTALVPTITCGSIQWTGSATSGNVQVGTTVTYIGAPIGLATVNNSNARVTISTVTATGSMTIYWSSTATETSLNFSWMTIGI